MTASTMPADREAERCALDAARAVLEGAASGDAADGLRAACGNMDPLAAAVQALASLLGHYSAAAGVEPVSVARRLSEPIADDGPVESAVADEQRRQVLARYKRQYAELVECEGLTFESPEAEVQFKARLTVYAGRHGLTDDLCDAGRKMLHGQPGYL